MPGKKKTSRHMRILFAGLAAIATAFSAVAIVNGVHGQSNQGQAAGQDPQDEIQFGIVYDCGSGKNKIKVVECDGDDDWDYCKVQFLNPASPNGIGLTDRLYRKTIKAMFAEGCKPKQDAKKKEGARPKVEPELEAKPAPERPESKPKPTPEEKPEPKENEQQKEDKPAVEPVTTAPKFQLGDCVKVGSSQGIITKTDDGNFYVQTEGGTTQVPFSSASKMKKANGCGGG